MKKILLAISAVIVALSSFAQSDVNRLIINDKNGGWKAFSLEKVDYAEFANVDGDVRADVVVSDVALDKVVLSITRTEACQGFKLSCVPTVQISNYSDDYLAQYIDKDTDDIYYQDFSGAELTGIELQPNTKYTIATVGVDEYNVLCDVARVDFTTPSLPTQGSPEVTAELVSANKYDFTVKFTPNADVSTYAVVAGEKGTLEAQYEMFAPMFGFANIGEMVEAWGIPQSGEYTNTWKNQSPGTEYEVYIQARDSEGVMAPHQIFYLTTESLGGEGIAEVTITLGEYKMMDWAGEMLPSQFVTYTPNDQSSRYRFGVYLASEYDPYADEIKAELCSDPDSDVPVSGWYQFETITTDYQINPNTEFVVIAAAKNINGEWGPIAEVRHTTPATTSHMPASTKIGQRNASKKAFQLGTVPTINKTGKVSLKAK